MCPQLPLSSSHLDVYTGPGMKGPAVAMTSNSCPANLTIKREISGAEPLHVATSSGARESLPSVPCAVIVQNAGRKSDRGPSSALG